MSYNPRQPRDSDGKWSDIGGAVTKQLDRVSTSEQRQAAGAIARGATRGIAEGIVMGVAMGALTGGAGAVATPGLIIRSALKGAIAGARMHPISVAVTVGQGAYMGLNAHRERVKSQVANDHKGKKKKK